MEVMPAPSPAVKLLDVFARKDLEPSSEGRERTEMPDIQLLVDGSVQPDGDPRLKRSPHRHFKGCFSCGFGGGGGGGYYQPPAYYPPVYTKPIYVEPVYTKQVYVQPVYVKPVVYTQPVYQKPVVYTQPVYQKPVYSQPYYGSGCSTCGGQGGGGSGSFSYSQSSASSSSYSSGYGKK